MPTTRRLRAKLYKTRCQRRKSRARARHRRFEAGPDQFGNGITRRSLAWQVFGHQLPRVFPKPGGPVYAPLAFEGQWRVEPRYKRLGVLEWTSPPYPFGAPGSHWPTPKLNVVLRLVQKVPKLRHIALIAYAGPLGAVPPTAFYPLEFYPSGGLSYAWQMGYRP